MSVNAVHHHPTHLSPQNSVILEHSGEIDLASLPVIDLPLSPPPFELSKPKLKRVELLIMDLETKIKALGKRTMGISLTKIEKENLTLEKLISSQLSADMDLAHSRSQVYLWSVLKNIGSSILAVFHMVFGTYLISTGGGTAAGSALVASGFLALANMALSESGGWNWIAACLEAENAEKQEMIAIMLPLLITILSVTFSLAGFAEVVQGQNIDELVSLLKDGTQIITSSGALGVAHGQHEALQTQIRSVKIENSMTLSKEHIDLFSRVFEELMREFDRVSSTVKKMIKQSIYESRAITMA